MSSSEEVVQASGSLGGGRRVWWAIAAIGTVSASISMVCAQWTRDGNVASSKEASLRLLSSRKKKQNKWAACTYEIMMLDTRSMPSAFDEDAYWSMTAVINHEYAKRFGYGFQFVRPKVNFSSLPYHVSWLKPLYLKHRLEELAASGNCTWVLYLDTDAFVRESDLPLPEFLGDLGARYRPVGTASAIFAQESSITAAFAAGDPLLQRDVDGGPPYRHKVAETGYWSPWQHVNSGVFFLKAGARGAELLDAWLRSGRHDHRVRHSWPAEQGMLTELLFPRKYQTTLPPCPCHARVAPHPDLAGVFAMVNFTEINGPWGRFVQHDWGGPGGERRTADFERELMRIGASDGGRFSELLREVHASMVAWAPSDF